MRLFTTLALAAATTLPACHAASKPSPQAAAPDANEPESTPEQTAQMQRMVEQLQRQLAEQQLLIRAYPPDGATIIPPITVDPSYSIADDQFLKQLVEQLQIELNNPPPAPDDQP